MCDSLLVQSAISFGSGRKLVLGFTYLPFEYALACTYQFRPILPTDPSVVFFVFFFGCCFSLYLGAEEGVEFLKNGDLVVLEHIM